MEKKSNIFERILQVAELKGLKNVSDLADYLGYSNPEKLYRLGRNPDAKPSFDILEDLTNKFEKLNMRWVISGEDEPYPTRSYTITPPLTSTVHEPDEYEKANSPSRKRGVSGIDIVPPTVPATPEMAVKSIYLTPQFITVDNKGDENILHVSQRAAAGYLDGYADPEYLGKLPSFNLPGLTDATYRSFEVDGDSMFPTLKNGQMVIGKWVEKLEYIREDRVYIVVHKTRGVIMKRLINRIDSKQLIFCKSDATNDRGLYKTFGIAPEDIKELWYAVFHGGFDFQSPTDMWKRLNNTEADVTTLQSTVDQLTQVIKNAGLLK